MQLPNPKMGGSGLFVCEQRSTGGLQPIISSAVLRCALRDKVPEGSGRFPEVPVQMADESARFRKVPGSSGARCGAKFRRVLEGSERGPRISGADAYCHVKDELHERGLVPQEG